MQTSSTLEQLMREFGLQAHKSLGQNFLRDPQILAKIVAAAEVTRAEDTLEIGPGLGSLTVPLAQAAKTVTAVELDERLFPALKRVLAPFDNVRLIHGDILALSAADLGLAEGYLVVANVPYYITSAIFRHLLETTPRPRRIVLTVQKEVAERICAAPGDLSLLALSVQVYGTPRIAAQIPASAFTPPPKVDSAVLRVDIFPQPLIPREQLEKFFRLTKAGFSQKRKTLRNSLSAGLGISPQAAAALLEKSAINPMRRAETLSLPEWAALTAQES
ncbi:MAG: 16S rRNA (adenine(1518)-N(6)/adenine(1519)-N(6)) -dimethyltransferase RsmA [Anaerolineales bacterium]